MSDEMKLLRAFIEASGFSVERTVEISHGRAMTAGDWGNPALAGVEYEFVAATAKIPQAEYKEVIRTTDYKVTKKVSNKSMLHQAIDQYEDGKISIDLLFDKIKIIEDY